MFKRAGNNNGPTTIVVPTLESAVTIEDALGPYFKQYRSGYYSKKSVTPILEDGQHYLYKQGNQNVTFKVTPEGLPEFLNQIPGWIIDQAGNVIADSRICATLTRFPQIPVNGLNIVRSYIEFIVARECKWIDNKKPFYAYLEKFFQEEIMIPLVCVEKTNAALDVTWCEQEQKFKPIPDLVSVTPNPIFVQCEETILFALNTLGSHLDHFISSDEGWGMYEIRHNTFSTALVKKGDFRIKEWMEQNASKYK